MSKLSNKYPNPLRHSLLKTTIIAIIGSFALSQFALAEETHITATTTDTTSSSCECNSVQLTELNKQYDEVLCN